MAKHTLPVSPLAPKRLSAGRPVAGVLIGTAAAGIRYRNRDDVMVARFAPGTAVAGVLTRSKSASAPVEWCRDQLARGGARALVVNAGNANAFTGRIGEAAVKATAVAASGYADCAPQEVFIASTGVIGEPLPVETLVNALPGAFRGASARGWAAAARAIMTTDTFPKLASARTEIDGAPVTITAIAKGSGMIAPDMATMLAFLATDAAIPAPVLQEILSEATDRSFNAITVDGDTSTSDTLLAFATGQGAKHRAVRSSRDTRLAGFRRAFDKVLLDLALLVVRDGEGAQKLIRIAVSGAESDAAARRIGLTIANSPLVKTAVAGEDANWGRIVAAVGRAGERADRDRLAIRIGGHPCAREGMRDPSYSEARLARHMKGRAIDIAVDLGIGRGAAVVWTCDLTHGYIDINGSYRS